MSLLNAKIQNGKSVPLGLRLTTTAAGCGKPNPQFEALIIVQDSDPKPQLFGPGADGSNCVVLYDVGNLASPIPFSMQVSHF